MNSSSLDAEELPRPDLALQIQTAVDANQLVVMTGASGFGQVASVRLASESMPSWEPFVANGSWLSSGYLSGFQELLLELLEDAEKCFPHVVARHEQTLKRIWPTRKSASYRVPSDLTNTSSREERTRFYHHEYQNKLLVGLAEFLIEILEAKGRSILLTIRNSSWLSPTSKSLIDIISRIQPSRERLRFILLDPDGTLFFPQAVTIQFSAYSRFEFEEQLGVDNMPIDQREQIYRASFGNLQIGRALKHCFENSVRTVGNLSAESVFDFFLATLSPIQRENLAVEYDQCDYLMPIARRNAEKLSSPQVDLENERKHCFALEKYKDGKGPLVLAYAMAVSNKYKRMELLVEPFEILMGIGLYDSWFSLFAPMFVDLDLRLHGSGDDPQNGIFLNAAFVLYAMGNANASSPFLEEFLERFPGSKFVPTALYAQSMTYGRYLVPVDLDRAEAYATQNLSLIKSRFNKHPKYKYILVFAENAYAYIKARQRKFDEALELCRRGNAEILAAYGEDTYRLHRSILIYNTSQIYEIIDDQVQAELHLLDAIACDPYYAEYYNDLGNLLSKIAGRESEAIEAYGRAIALSPPYFEAHLNRGLLLAQTGDSVGAINDFERVLEIKPQEWRALREIGNVRLEGGDLSAALDAYLGALHHEEMDADLQANLGLAYSELGQEESAVCHYNLAIALRPTHAEAHNNLAAELVKRGMYESALKHASLATKYGDDPDFVANMNAIKAIASSS